MSYDEVPYECKCRGFGKECDGLQWIDGEGYTCIAPQCPLSFKCDPDKPAIRSIYK